MSSGYSLFTNFSFDAAKNNLDCYRSWDYMEKLCNDLREHPVRIVKYEKKRNDIANWRRKEVSWKAKIGYVCKKKLVLIIMMMILTIKK